MFLNSSEREGDDIGTESGAHQYGNQNGGGGLGVRTERSRKVLKAERGGGGVFEDGHQSDRSGFASWRERPVLRASKIPRYKKMRIGYTLKAPFISFRGQAMFTVLWRLLIIMIVESKTNAVRRHSKQGKARQDANACVPCALFGIATGKCVPPFTVVDLTKEGLSRGPNFQNRE